MIARLVFAAALGTASLAGIGPVAAQAGVQVADGVPDGDYKCHKLSPSGGLRQMGAMEVRRGRARLPGLPDGWTVTGVSPRGKNPRGETVVAFDYRSTAGISDRLDCVLQ
jgi:hypothetical protein